MTRSSRFRDGLPRLEINRQRNPVLEGHVHGHLELNYLFCGGFDYRLAGRTVAVPTRRWVLFWASLPHTLEACVPGTDILSLAVPIGTVLLWPGVEPLQRRLMAGEVLVLPADEGDGATAARWSREGTDPARQPLVLLEIEALVRRAALGLGAAARGRSGPDLPLSRAFGTMIELLHRRSGDPISLGELAASAGMKADTASRLFRRCAGCSIRSYQQRLRVAQARRLLVGTTLPIIDIALRCGYQSLSRFYASYVRVFGETPSASRKREAR
jgi:AraC-like DNA-binding protein